MSTSRISRRGMLLTPAVLRAAGQLSAARLERAAQIVSAAKDVSAAVLHVEQGAFHFSRAFGTASTPATPFLLASITKPMTAAGVMILVDRGLISLDDPVSRRIQEFQGSGRERVTIRHLLTHTSGLPDMLPENVDLRKRHSPLSAFVAGTCKVPLQFEPGARVQYQSMGVLLAATIVERVTRIPFRDFLRKELFTPLGMSATSLGLGGRAVAEMARCQVDEVTDWDWNSTYWRDLGAPWGGAHATATDVARFLNYFAAPAKGPLRSATATQMISLQTRGLNESWGLGFRLGEGAFGRSCSARTFGHYGSTGTVAWHDPDSRVTCVLLTTKPAASSRQHLLGPVSDAVAEAAGAS